MAPEDIIQTAVGILGLLIAILAAYLGWRVADSKVEVQLYGF